MKKEEDRLSYLNRLPLKSRYRGSVGRGEIEIVGKTPIRETPEIGIVFEDEYITVVRDPVEFPSGAVGTYLRILESSGFDGPAGVVVLPTLNGFLYLCKIFRHATRQWELECPRGFRGEGMSAEVAAVQEIKEEIGMDVKSMQCLGFINPNSGLLADSAQAFIAFLEDGEPAPNPEEGEAFGAIFKLTKLQVEDKIKNGEIRDGYTLSALQLAAAFGLY